MSPRTFSRKGRASVASPSSASKKSLRGKQGDPFDLLAEPEDCSDPLSPFFFGDLDQEDPEQAPPKARDSAKNCSAKAVAAAAQPGSSKSRRARAGLSVPSSPASGGKSGRGTQQQRSRQPAPGPTPKPAQQAGQTPAAAALPSPARARGSKAPKQHPEEKVRAENHALGAAGAAPQQARQPSAEAQEQAGEGVAGLPSAGATRAGKGAGQAAAAASSQLEQQLPDGGPTKPGGPSPGKRGPSIGAAPTGSNSGRPPRPSKRMKPADSCSDGGLAAGSAVAATAAAPAERASGRAAAPANVPSVAGLQLAALARLLHPAALREQAAATTVVQAQALGEQQSIM